MYQWGIEIVSGLGLGVSYSSYGLIGSLFPKRAVTDTGLEIFYNIATGNVIIKDHPCIIPDKRNPLEIGLIYNSQSPTPWRLNLKSLRIAQDGNPILTEGDGHETLYTWNPSSNHYEAPGLNDGTPYLKKNLNNGWTWIHPGTGTEEEYDADGNLTKRINLEGLVTSFTDKNKQTKEITTSSGKKYYINYTDNKWTINEDKFDGRELQAFHFENSMLVKTTIENQVITQYTNMGSQIMDASTAEGIHYKFNPGSRTPHLKDISIGQIESDPHRDIYDFSKMEKNNFHIKVGSLTEIDLSLDSQNRITRIDESLQKGDQTFKEVRLFEYHPEGQLKTETDVNGAKDTFEYKKTLPLKGILTKHTRKDLSILEKFFDENQTKKSPLKAISLQSQEKADKRITRFAHMVLPNHPEGFFLHHTISPEGRVIRREPDIYGLIKCLTKISRGKFILNPNKESAFIINDSKINEWFESLPRRVNPKEKLKPNTLPFTSSLSLNDSIGNLKRHDLLADMIIDNGEARYDEKSINNESDIYQYDQNNNLKEHLQKQTADENIRKWARSVSEFDYLNRPLKIYDALGSYHQFTYTLNEKNCFVITEQFYEKMGPNKKDQLHYTKKQVFDQTKRLSSESFKDEIQTNTPIEVTTYKRDSNGCPIKVIAPGNLVTWQCFDSRGELALSASPGGIKTRYQFNASSGYRITCHQANLLDPAKEIDQDQLKNSFVGIEKNPELKNPLDIYSYEFLDLKKRVQYSINGDGYIIEFTYDDQDNIIAKTSYAEKIKDEELDLLKQRKEIDFKANQSYRLERKFYNDDNQLIGEMDALGYISENVLDDQNRIIEIIQYAKPIAPGDRNKYWKELNLDCHDTNNAHHYRIYNGKDQLVQEVDPEGYLTQHTYHLSGTLETSTRFTTKLNMEEWLQSKEYVLSPITSSEDQKTQREYDLLNREISVSNSQGLCIQKAYDAMNNLIREHSFDLNDPKNTDGDHSRASLKRYNASGQLTQELNPNVAKMLLDIEAEASDEQTKQAAIEALWAKHSNKYEYNEAGLLCRSLDSLQNPSITYFDKDKRPVFILSVSGVLTEIEYDAFHNIRRKQISVKRVDTTLLNELKGGFITQEVQDQLKNFQNNNEDSITRFTKYDKRGNWEEKFDPENNRYEQKHDAYGNLVLEKIPVNSKEPTLEIIREYDALNRELSVTQKANDKMIKTSKSYDFLEIMETDACGAKTLRKHDKLGNETDIISEVEGDLKDVIKNEFDAFSRIISTRLNTNKPTQHKYNQAERTHRVIPPIQSTAFTVKENVFQEDIHSQIDSETESNSWTHTPDGQIHTHTDELDRTHITDFNTEGHIEHEILADHTVTEYKTNAAGETTERVEDAENVKRKTSYKPYVLGGNSEIIQYHSSESKESIKKIFEIDKSGHTKAEITDPDSLKWKVSTPVNAQGKTIGSIKGDAIAENQSETATLIDDFNRTVGKTLDPTISCQNPSHENPNALNLVYSQILDAAGRTIAEIDPRSTTDKPIISYTLYNKLGRKRFTINSLGFISEWVYGSNQKIYCERIYSDALDIQSINTNTTIAELQKRIESLQNEYSDNSERYHFYDDNQRETFVAEVYTNPQGEKLAHISESRYDLKSRVNQLIQFGKPTSATNIANFKTETLAKSLVNAYEDLNNRVVYSIHDAKGNLCFAIDAEGFVTEQKFDINDNMVQKTQYATKLDDPAAFAKLSVLDAIKAVPRDPSNDRSSYYLFDTINQHTHTINPEGAVQAFERDINNNITRTCEFAVPLTNLENLEKAKTLVKTLDEKDPKNRITKAGFDAISRPSFRQDALGFKDTFEYEYKDLHAFIKHKDRRGNIWLKEIDRAKRLSAEISPERSVVSTSIKDGQIVEETKKIAVRNTNQYDRASNLEMSTLGENTAEPRPCLIAHDGANNLVSATVINVAIDDEKQETKQGLRPEELVSIQKKIRRNALGKIFAEQAENGYWTFTIHDALGRPIYQLEPVCNLEITPENASYRVKFIDYNVFDEEKVIRYINPITLTGEMFERAKTSGLPASIMPNVIRIKTDKDQTTQYKHDKNGKKTQIIRDSIFHHFRDGKGLSNLLKFRPKTEILYNGFGEVIERKILQGVSGNEEIYASHKQWRNRLGKVLASISPKNSLTRRSYTTFGQEEKRIEYRDYLKEEFSPSDPRSLERIIAIAEQMNNPLNRYYQKVYDLRGNEIEDSQFDIAQYEARKYFLDYLRLERTETRGVIKRKKEYSPTQKLKKTTLENGQSFGTFYDEADNRIAESGVTRRTKRKTKDGSLEEHSVTPFTSYGINAHGQISKTQYHAQGVNPITDFNNLPTINKDDNDLVSLEQFSNIGLSTAKQDPTGHVKQTSYNKMRKAARIWENYSSFDVKNPKNKILHIDETRILYDAIARKVREENRRDNILTPYSVHRFVLDVFDNIVQEGIGEELLQFYRKFDQCNNLWSTNEDKGAPCLYLTNLAKNITAKIVSRSGKTDLSEVDYEGLANVFSADFDGAVSMTRHDQEGKPIEYISPSVKLNPSLLPIPLQMTVTTNSKLIWPAAHVSSVIATQIIFKPSNTPDAEGIVMILEQKSQPDENLSFCELDLTHLASDQYDYQIVYYAKDSNGHLDSTRPLYQSLGSIQINNGPNPNSHNVIVTALDQSLKLSGNIDGITEIDLVDENGASTRLRVNAGLVNISSQTTGRYTLIPYRNNQALKPSLPFHIQTEHESNIVYAEELNVEALISIDEMSANLKLDLPSVYLRASLHLSLSFETGEPLELDIPVNASGNYPFELPSGNHLIKTLSLDLRLGEIKTISLYRNQPPKLAKTAENKTQHLIKSNLGEDFHNIHAEEDHDDWHLESANTEFSPVTLIYIKPLKGLDPLTTPDLNFTNVSFDVKASQAILPILNYTDKGIVVDVSTLPSGNYPFVNPLDDSTATFTIKHNNQVYSGSTLIQTNSKDLQAVTKKLERDPWHNIVAEINSLNQRTDILIDHRNKEIQRIFAEVDVMLSDNQVHKNFRPAIITLRDVMGQAICTINRNGHATLFDVNEAGQNLKTTLADGSISLEQGFDALDQQIAFARGNGKAWEQKFGKNKQIILQTSPLGRTEGFEHDQKGNIAAEADGLGQKTLYNRDTENSVTERIAPNQAIAESTYGIDKTLIKYKDSDGELSWTPDEFGNVKGHIDLGGAEYKYELDFNKQRIKANSSGGQHGTQFKLTVKQRQIEVTDHNGRKRYPFRPTFTINEVNEPNQNQELTYEAGRLVQITDRTLGLIVYFHIDTEDRRVDTLLTDLEGKLIRHQTANINALAHEVQTFDTDMTMDVITDPEGNRRKITIRVTNPYTGEVFTDIIDNLFDPAERLLKSTSSSGHHSNYTFENNLPSSESIDGKTQKFIHDDDNLLIESRDIKTNELHIKRIYDPAKRVVELLNYVNKTHREEKYEENSDNVKQINFYRDGVNSKTLDAVMNNQNFTASGIPQDAETTLLPEHADKITEKSHTIFTPFDTLQEAEVSGSRDGKNAIPSKIKLNANSHINGFAHLEESNLNGSPQTGGISNLLTLPTGENLVKVTARDNMSTRGYTEEAKVTNVYSNVNGQPVLQVTQEFKKVDTESKEFEEAPKISMPQHYGTSASGGTAFVAAQQPAPQNGKRENSNDRRRKAVNLSPHAGSLEALGPLRATDLNESVRPYKYKLERDMTYEDLANQFGSIEFADQLREANGNKALRAGEDATIPSMVKITNKANDYISYADFKAKMIPTLRPHMPIKEEDDGFLEQMVHVVAMTIAVVMAAQAGGLTGFFANTLGFSGMFAAGAAGAVTDAAIQATAKTLGIEKHFSVVEVAEAGVGGAIQTLGLSGLYKAAYVAVDAAVFDMVNNGGKLDIRNVITAVAAELIASKIDELGDLSKAQNSEHEMLNSSIKHTIHGAVNSGIGSVVTSALFHQSLGATQLAASMVGGGMSEGMSTHLASSEQNHEEKAPDPLIGIKRLSVDDFMKKFNSTSFVASRLHEDGEVKAQVSKPRQSNGNAMFASAKTKQSAQGNRVSRFKLELVNPKYTKDWVTIGAGASQAAGGFGQMVGGAIFGIATAETGIGMMAGLATAANGFDQFNAGLKTVFSGEEKHTVLNDGLRKVGVGGKYADLIDSATSLVGPGTLLGAVKLKKYGSFFYREVKHNIKTVRYQTIVSGASKKEVREVLKNNKIDVKQPQIQKIKDILTSGKMDRINIKVLPSEKIRVSAERPGRTSGYQRLSFEVSLEGKTTKLVQTAFDNDNILVRQNPGEIKNNLYDVKEWTNQTY